MAITTRDLGPADTSALADLMTRIEADHPTGFCLGAQEIGEIMADKPDAVFEGAFDGTQLVAYTTVMPSSVTERGQRFILFGDVDPTRTGEGIGTLMLARSLARSRAIHAVAAPGGSVRYASQALAGRDDQADLLASAGMQPGRHSFLMVADLPDDLPEPDLPDGVSVEPLPNMCS